MATMTRHAGTQRKPEWLSDTASDQLVQSHHLSGQQHLHVTVWSLAPASHGLSNCPSFILWRFHPINISLWQALPFCCWFQPTILEVNINLSHKLILLIFLHFTPITLGNSLHIHLWLAAPGMKGRPCGLQCKSSNAFPFSPDTAVLQRTPLLDGSGFDATPSPWELNTQLSSRLSSPITSWSCTPRHGKPSHSPG